MIPTDLCTNHLTDPLAIAPAAPRLSWRLASGNSTAWQIQVARDPDFSQVVCDSGVVEGAEQATRYAGPPLTAGQRCWWRVRVRQDDQIGDWSESAQFAGGLDQWQAQWIYRSFDRIEVAPAFRREFAVPEDLREACLYVTARGLVHVTCNGQATSDECFAPGWTDYRQRIYYRCHDITDLLHAGTDNCLGALLGDGWYRGHLGPDGHCCHYGLTRELLLQLVMTDASGNQHLVVSDDQWRAAPSHILSNDLYHGESHDVQAARDGWDRIGFGASNWEVPMIGTLDDTPVLQPHPAPPVRPIEIIAPQDIWQAQRGRWIVDLGQNIAGRVRLTLRNVPAATVIRLRHGELVNPDRTLYVENLRTARAEDSFISRGDDVVVFEPLFTFHGFRYVEITGLGTKPDLADIAGVVLATAQDHIGNFSCDHPLINQLVSNIRWTWIDNTLEIPTDCPQRDERLGWTGDIAAFVPSATMLDDCHAFLAKWLQDLRDTQNERGCVGNVAPHPCRMIFEWPFEHADAGWGDAITVVPWELYQASGDIRVLEDNFPAMLKWVAYLEQDSNDQGIRRYVDGKHCVCGDWLNVDAPCSKDLLMTAWYARSVDRTRLTATSLGDHTAAQHLANLFDHITTGFRTVFMDDQGQLTGPDQDNCSQTAQATALAFGLVSGSDAELVFDRLVDDIEQRGRRLSVGFLGISYLLNVLSDHGRHDLAETIITNEDFPGPLFSVINGATTVWERWDGWTPTGGPHAPGMNSYNHYAYGSVYHWLVSRVAGIRLLEPGGTRIGLSPQFGSRLHRIQAHWTGPQGTCRIAWAIDGNQAEMDIEVPANSVAQLALPDHSDWTISSEPALLGPGIHHGRAQRKPSANTS